MIRPLSISLISIPFTLPPAQGPSNTDHFLFLQETMSIPAQKASDQRCASVTSSESLPQCLQLGKAACHGNCFKALIIARIL